MEVNETGEWVRCQVIQAEFPFLPGPSSVSWAVRDWVPAKVMSANCTRSFYNRLLKPLLMWCPTVFLIFHLDEEWPREKFGSLCACHNPWTHTGTLSEKEIYIELIYSIFWDFFFFKQLPLPSLTYLFYGKHHLHSSSDFFLEQHSNISKAMSHKNIPPAY